MQSKKGFTLIELLVVIAILAILATVVVVVLNPAQMLAEARDSQRLSDMASIRSAINLYLTTASTTVSVGSGTGRMTFASVCPFAANSGVCDVNATTTVDGSGWVEMTLTDSSGGAALSMLPLDPRNNTNFYYAYVGNSADNTYEVDSRLESNKYRVKMTNDGGNKNSCGTDFGITVSSSTCFYEMGNAQGLAL